MKASTATAEHSQVQCTRKLMPVKDALEVLEGKWKLQVIVSLMFGTKRFRQISKDVNGITDKMLSKVLKDLEMNQLIERAVYDSFPPTVEYSMTDYGKTLRKVIEALGNWGATHRERIMGK